MGSTDRTGGQEALCRPVPVSTGGRSPGSPGPCESAPGSGLGRGVSEPQTWGPDLCPLPPFPVEEGRSGTDWLVSLLAGPACPGPVGLEPSDKWLPGAFFLPMCVTPAIGIEREIQPAFGDGGVGGGSRVSGGCLPWSSSIEPGRPVPHLDRLPSEEGGAPRGGGGAWPRRPHASLGPPFSPRPAWQWCGGTAISRHTGSPLETGLCPWEAGALPPP